MATWILLNTTKFNASSGPVLLPAGKTIDDTKYNLTLIKAAGGIVVPSTDSIAAAAALIAQKRIKQGLANESQDSLLDLTMIAAVAGEANAAHVSRSFTTKAAGQTVAAGAAISAAVTYTPTFSGKLNVWAWASFQALGAGIVTPVLKQGSTAICAPAPSAGTGGPLNYYVEFETAALPLGTAVTFNWTTTAGDATVTLGNGATGIAARLQVEERP